MSGDDLAEELDIESEKITIDLSDYKALLRCVIAAKYNRPELSETIRKVEELFGEL